jgi:transcriptional regulator with XRE-family HTH domain
MTPGFGHLSVAALSQANAGTRDVTSPPTSDRRGTWLHAAGIRTTEEERAYARERCIVAVTETIAGCMADAGLSQRDLAERINRSTGHVSRVLNGTRNMTLGTLAEMLHACGVEVRGVHVGPFGAGSVNAPSAGAGIASPPAVVAHGYRASDRVPSADIRPGLAA